MRTKTSRFGWVFGVFGAWASYAGLVIAPGCGATDTNNGGTDSNTHWLEPCERDSECGGLSCVCGVCTEPCEDDGACSELDGASCALLNTCSGPRDEASCVVGCRNDADCADLGASFACDGGQCLHVSLAAGGSDGQGGDGQGGDGGRQGGDAGSSGTPTPGGGMAGNGGAAGGPPNGGMGPIAGFAGEGGRPPITGGSAGNGAVAGAGAPSTGGTGPTGPCAPMDVRGPSGPPLPCLPGPASYYWNGTHCTAFSECICEGEDCDELYGTMSACDASYDACYVERGITGACESDDDCKLTYRGCCASCGEQSFESLAATNEAEEALWQYCPTDPLCPECVQGGPTPEAVAKCEAGRCTVASICEELDVTACEEAEQCEPLYARFPGALDMAYMGCRFSGEGAPECSAAEVCGVDGTAQGDTSCMIFGSGCMPRRFIPFDCSSTACLP